MRVVLFAVLDCKIPKELVLILFSIGQVIAIQIVHHTTPAKAWLVVGIVVVESAFSWSFSLSIGACKYA